MASTRIDMQIKRAGIRSNRDTQIAMLSPNVVRVDGVVYEFAAAAIAWPRVAEETGGAITEAHREDGELCMTILCRYRRGGAPREGYEAAEPTGESVEGAVLLAGQTAEEVIAAADQAANATRRAEILAELDAIDRQGARAARAIAAGTGTDDDRARLAELEERAARLRAEMGGTK